MFTEYEHVDEMVDKLCMSSLTHSSTVRQTIMSAMSQHLRSDLGVAGNSDPLQHRPSLPKLDILAVDADEELPEEWEAEDDVTGAPLDPREVKTAREKEIMYLWDMEVYEYYTGAEARARTGRNQLASSGPIPTKEAPKPHDSVRVWCVIKGSNRYSRQHLRRKLCESYSLLRVKKTFFESRTLSSSPLQT